MTTFTVVRGLLMLAAGVALTVWGFRALLHRPGWGGLYGRGALVTLLGAFLALAGVVTVLIA